MNTLLDLFFLPSLYKIRINWARSVFSYMAYGVWFIQVFAFICPPSGGFKLSLGLKAYILSTL